MEAQYTMIPENGLLSVYSVCGASGAEIYRMRIEPLKVRFFSGSAQECRLELRPEVWYSRTTSVIEQPVGHRLATLRPESLIGDSWILLDETSSMLATLRQVRLKESGQIDRLIATSKIAHPTAGWAARMQRMFADLQSVVGTIPYGALYVRERPIVHFFRGAANSPLNIQLLEKNPTGITEPMVLAAAVKVLGMRHTVGKLTARDQADLRQAVRAAAATG